MAPEGTKKIDDGEVIRVPVVYTGIDDLPIQFSNAFLFQQTHGMAEFILSFGHIAPPVVVGTPEEVAQQAKKITFVQAKMLARFGLTEERFRQLVALLVNQLRVYDEAKAKEERR